MVRFCFGAIKVSELVSPYSKCLMGCFGLRLTMISDLFSLYPKCPMGPFGAIWLDSPRKCFNGLLSLRFDLSDSNLIVFVAKRKKFNALLRKANIH